MSYFFPTIELCLSNQRWQALIRWLFADFLFVRNDYLSIRFHV